jgi:hypothetical protein
MISNTVLCNCKTYGVGRCYAPAGKDGLCKTCRKEHEQKGVKA